MDEWDHRLSILTWTHTASLTEAGRYSPVNLLPHFFSSNLRETLYLNANRDTLTSQWGRWRPIPVDRRGTGVS